MKLSHNYSISHSEMPRANQLFNQRLHRQSDGFGLFAGSSGYSADYRKIAHTVTPYNTSKDFYGLVVKASSFVGSAALKSAVAVRHSWENYRVRHEQRLSLRKLLGLSDHYLRDIGVARYEVEFQLRTNGNLDQLIRNRRTEKPGIPGKPDHLSLIDCSLINRGTKSTNYVGIEQAA